MSFSMDAARLAETDRRICDLCGALSSAPRGSSCPRCAIGTVRYRSELQLMREARRAARRAARDSAPRP